jgi:integrase
MLCTGIREQELCNLEVLDLRQKVDGKLALHVREGKGAKTRLVPYGALDWCLVIVDRWLDVAGIIEGPVFRAVSKAGAVLSGNLTTRAIQQITAGYTRDGQHIGGYPIPVDSELCYARPHDLRRTYARRLYDAGVAVKAIQENLGHASQETTLGYIGDLDFDQRQPPAVYTFDLSVLRHAPAAQRRSEEIER